ncbi:GNAT family N-acetyltransferase [Priestia taiwanensis]|uniref:N-acetyltransferase n=1 Tax=Priestia taiwanensis TaxID=1347902 RepID=A0A917AML8_9BACI|nr:GNAT family N-acetyltransferase [Priestia taiwanensis]MBM7362284.1 GNAT superfamily N-acetyltransferase [Priestia taiwanensis]GGE60964.1 N-acetyltransferase [Priestia taiwanensis]
MIIRSAIHSDCEILSKIAYQSKAYWGYSEEFLTQCKNDLTITKEYIDRNLVYVMEVDNKLIAFYSFSLQETKLEALFISPSYIGQGLGRKLWSHALQQAKQLQLNEFTIDSDPYAEEFYLKMGAKRVGEIQSTVFPERYLPLMSVHVI